MNELNEFYKLFNGSKNKHEFEKEIFKFICSYKNLDVSEALKTFKYIKEGKYPTDYLPLKRWIESNYTDGSVHGMSIYMLDILNSSSFACTNSIRNVCTQVKNNFKDINSIVDFGAGIGITTIMLANTLKDKDIFYYDLYNKSFIESLINNYDLNVNNLTIIKLNEIVNVDCIITLEMLEHLKDPIQFVRENDHYRYWVQTNAFSNVHVGHYPSFLYEGKEIPGRSFVRKFNKFMREFYDEIYRGWNSKPVIYRKK